MNKIAKLVSAVSTEMLLLATTVSATDVSATDAWSENGVSISSDATANSIMSEIAKFVRPIAAILVFGSVLMIGFEIIMKRNKADDRMASMTSLMWVGIGTLVIAFAALIASFLFI